MCTSGCGCRRVCVRAYVSGRVCMYVAASSKKRIYNWHYIIIMLMMFNTALMEVHAENSFKEQGSLLIDIFRLYCVNISFLSIIILILSLIHI